jgi:hypothetical protein
VDGRIAEGAPPVRHLDDVPSVAKASPPSMAPIVALILSPLLCGAQGVNLSGNFPRPESLRSPEAITGAIIGFVIACWLAVDSWLLQRKINALEQTRETSTNDLVASAQRPSDWLSALMLVLPVASGAFGWFARDLGLTNLVADLVGSGVIIATGILGYFNIRQLSLRIEARRSESKLAHSPMFAYLTIVGFWIIGYPVHFLLRRNLGGRNWIVPALLAMAAYLAPFGRELFGAGELPSVDDREVLSLVRQMVEDEPMMKPATVSDPVQVKFDEANQTRTGRCTVTTKFGKEPVNYKIEWQDRKTGMWQVSVADRLPMVNAPEVLDFIKDILRDRLWDGNRIRLDPVIIRNAEQTGYDPIKQQRMGKARASAGRGDGDITYIITWADAERKQFNVEVNGRPR